MGDSLGRRDGEQKQWEGSIHDMRLAFYSLCFHKDTLRTFPLLFRALNATRVFLGLTRLCIAILWFALLMEESDEVLRHVSVNLALSFSRYLGCGAPKLEVAGEVRL